MRGRRHFGEKKIIPESKGFSVYAISGKILAKLDATKESQSEAGECASTAIILKQAPIAFSWILTPDSKDFADAKRSLLNF